jgi:hypothetical protein
MIEWIALATLGTALLATEQEQSKKTRRLCPGDRVKNGVLLQSIDRWCGTSCPIRYGIEPIEVYGDDWIPEYIDFFTWLTMPSEYKKYYYKTRWASAKPWTDDFRWTPEKIYPELEYDHMDEVWRDQMGRTYEDEYDAEDYWLGAEITIQAHTWPDFNLFPELKPIPPKKRNLVGSETHTAKSPSGRWTYINQTLPKTEVLKLHKYDSWENEVAQGNVMFDGPVVIPTVLEHGQIWMSHTPQEVLSQIEAISKSHGKVIIGGLGLGWSLVQAANNPFITEVILVEKSQELADWILPRLCPYLPKDKPIHVVIGDAEEVLPKLTADIALLDIWPTYTEVEEEVVELMEKCPDIAAWWAWGNDWEVDDIRTSDFVTPHTRDHGRRSEALRWARNSQRTSLKNTPSPPGLLPALPPGRQPYPTTDRQHLHLPYIFYAKRWKNRQEAVLADRSGRRIFAWKCPLTPEDRFSSRMICWENLHFSDLYPWLGYDDVFDVHRKHLARVILKRKPAAVIEIDEVPDDYRTLIPKEVAETYTDKDLKKRHLDYLLRRAKNTDLKIGQTTKTPQGYSTAVAMPGTLGENFDLSEWVRAWQGYNPRTKASEMAATYGPRQIIDLARQIDKGTLPVEIEDLVLGYPLCSTAAKLGL